jgi:hypothetical protein
MTENSKVLIILGVLTLVGTIGGALINNMSKSKVESPIAINGSERVLPSVKNESAPVPEYKKIPPESDRNLYRQQMLKTAKPPLKSKFDESISPGIGADNNVRPSTPITSSAPTIKECEKKNFGDYWFKNETQSKISVSLWQGQQKKRKTEIDIGQSQWLFEIPSGVYKYCIILESRPGSNYYSSNYVYKTAEIKVEHCSSETVIIR